ncbi:LppX_LprAFG lipoprotein [Amycolatopsis sp. YIM 10]|uniref:LppX_LprAFG lipoprotein n=1 Tax=Amycolatopsis sp. YIM 10 TaxID=2653857 RepID=UPI00128FE596|nr:LppX_LprAFG lipoprotein [Amycolatopsis sp. YIM 10]QFU93764.1 Lipoprotein LprG precursor [Amycolatopsis sp. YIM 10]
MFMRRILLGALALAVTAATGCSSDEPDTSSFPPAEQLVQEATAATSAVRSTHFSLQVNGSVTGLSVQSLDGDLTKEGGPSGAAKGTGRMEVNGQLIEAEFVVVQDNFYLKGPTGTFQKVPAFAAAAVYDPSAILDPQRGIAKLVSSLQNPKTEAEEDVDGTATWKVSGRIGKDVLVALLPGVQTDADLTFWLAKDTKLPVKATAKFPDNASVDVKLSDVDKPVTVTPPA